MHTQARNETESCAIDIVIPTSPMVWWWALWRTGGSGGGGGGGVLTLNRLRRRVKPAGEDCWNWWCRSREPRQRKRARDGCADLSSAGGARDVILRTSRRWGRPIFTWRRDNPNGEGKLGFYGNRKRERERSWWWEWAKINFFKPKCTIWREKSWSVLFTNF